MRCLFQNPYLRSKLYFGSYRSRLSTSSSFSSSCQLLALSLPYSSLTIPSKSKCSVLRRPPKRHFRTSTRVHAADDHKSNVQQQIHHKPCSHSILKLCSPQNISHLHLKDMVHMLWTLAHKTTATDHNVLRKDGSYLSLSSEIQGNLADIQDMYSLTRVLCSFAKLGQILISVIY